MRAIAVLAAGACAFAFSLTSAIADESSVLTYHGNNDRSGNYVVPALSWDKVGSVHLDGSFDARVAGHLYAQPLYWHPQGSEAVLVTASEDNVVQAFDAASGTELWRRVVGRPIRRSALPCGNIDPLGITGTPVIDPVTQAIYFDAAVERPSGPRHELFGLALKDGTVLPGWPIDVADALQKAGGHFDPRVQNQRSALTVFRERLYVAFSGHYGDCGDYHGWVIGLPLQGSGGIVSFETRARGGGIWAPGGLSVADDRLFFATGNTFGASSWSDGEAVFRLKEDLRRTDSRQDYFAPSDWKALDAQDEDLGGSNPLPLGDPDAAGPGLMLALGKDRKAYLLDRSNLGGINGQLVAESVATARIVTSPVAYPAGNDVFVAFQAPGAHCPEPGGGLTVLKIIRGRHPVMSTAWCGAVNGRGSPIVTTSDGHSNPIVWALGAEGDNRLHAFRGDTGQPIFASEPLVGLRHLQTLIATQGRIYVGADDRLYAFRF
jgi:outer membrane protein assembly factor BamB